MEVFWKVIKTGQNKRNNKPPLTIPASHYMGGLELINTSQDLMNNFTATVGLKFGKF